MRKIPQWEFDFYALSLPRGHAFGDEPPVAAWGGSDGRGCGIVTRNEAAGTFSIVLMRRRIDSVWTVIREHSGYPSIEAAREALEPLLAEGSAARASPAWGDTPPCTVRFRRAATERCLSVTCDTGAQTRSMGAQSTLPCYAKA